MPRDRDNAALIAAVKTTLALRKLPRLYDSDEDAAFEDEEIDEQADTQPSRSVSRIREQTQPREAGSGIRSFFEEVVAELERASELDMGDVTVTKRRF